MFKQGSLQSLTLENRQVFCLHDESLNLPQKNITVATVVNDNPVNSKHKENINSTHVNLEKLRCFEVVERQYADIGVTFDNCIAICPSNPAYPANSGTIVLLGAPRSGFMEAKFAQPVKIVTVFVTSSQRLVMSAYNRDREPIAKAVTPGANLANTNSIVPPNLMLQVQAKDIHYVTFDAFNGQFTVDDFSFCD